MKITIEAKPKEIADLVSNLQGQPSIELLPNEPLSGHVRDLIKTPLSGHVRELSEQPSL